MDKAGHDSFMALCISRSYKNNEWHTKEALFLKVNEVYILR
jgi:hypothetical protein